MKQELPKEVKEAKRYCVKCGKRLIFKRKKLVRYNYISGEKEIEYYFECPNRSLLSIFHSDAFLADDGEEV